MTLFQINLCFNQGHRVSLCSIEWHCVSFNLSSIVLQQITLFFNKHDIVFQMILCLMGFHQMTSCIIVFQQMPLRFNSHCVSLYFNKWQRVSLCFNKWQKGSTNDTLFRKALCFNKRHCGSTHDIVFQQMIRVSSCFICSIVFQHMALCFNVFHCVSTKDTAFQQMTLCFKWHCASTNDIVVQHMTSCSNRWYVFHRVSCCFILTQQWTLLLCCIVLRKWHGVPTNAIFNEWHWGPAGDIVSQQMTSCFVVLQQMTLCLNKWHYVSLRFVGFQTTLCFIRVSTDDIAFQITLCFILFHCVSAKDITFQQMTHSICWACFSFSIVFTFISGHCHLPLAPSVAVFSSSLCVLVLLLVNCVWLIMTVLQKSNPKNVHEKCWLWFIGFA